MAENLVGDWQQFKRSGAMATDRAFLSFPREGKRQETVHSLLPGPGEHYPLTCALAQR
jgi:hypothetical protein